MTSLPRLCADGSPRRRLLHAVRSVVWRRAEAVLFAGVLMFLGIGGCAAPTAKTTAAEAPAVVVVENHTDYVWRIAFTPANTGAGGGAEAAWQKLAPREIRRVELTGGVYEVRRVLGGGDTETSASTDGRIELTFESGKTYAWPLGTLLSSERGSP